MGKVLIGLFWFANIIGAADPLSWFPLQVGHRWVYDCVSKDGDPRHPEVSRGTARVTVLNQIPTSEGLVIVRAVTFEGYQNASLGPLSLNYALLVRGDCVYPLDSEAWDRHKRAFMPGFSEYIKEISPMVCFPLHTGATWKGTRDGAWTVAGMGPASRGPQDVPADAFRLERQQAGETVYVWFRPGIGPVASWSWHNGSYTEQLETLRR